MTRSNALVKKLVFPLPNDLTFDNEISQEGNLNATARLWIQNDCTVYKEYVIYNEITEKNIYNLLLIATNVFLRHVPELSLPLAIYSKGNKVAGYLMEYYKMHSLGYYLDKRDHRIVLKAFQQLAELINRLPRNVYVGDLHAGNILVNNDIIRIIDIDGFSLKYGYKISCPLKAFSNHSIFYHKKYCDRRGDLRISRNSDICCLLWLFLSYLMEANPFDYTEEEIRRYLLFLKRLGLPQTLYEMITCMMSSASNYLIPSAFEKVPIEMLSCCSYRQYVYNCVPSVM